MTWRPLFKGDIVDIIAPAHGISDRDISKASEYIKSLGLTPNIPDNLIGEDLFHSNSHDMRLEHLKNALTNNESKAIWCIKGGYGTAHLIPNLTEMPKPPNAKLLIGFSDITALHIFLNDKWGWNSLHAPILWQMTGDKISNESAKQLEQLIFGNIKEVSLSLISLNNAIISNIKSTVTGGNLTILQNSIGTDWQIDTVGKILLIEEVDEEPYKIDRSLLHLKQAGIFNDVRAIIFGDFNYKNKAKEHDAIILELLLNFTELIDAPVFRATGVGHTEINNAIPLGTEATIESNILTCKSN